MKDFKEYKSVEEVIADARSENLINCVLCDYHIRRSKARTANVSDLGSRPLSPDGVKEKIVELIKNNDPAKLSVTAWDLYRISRQYHSALKELIAEGDVISIPKKGPRGRPGFTYAWKTFKLADK